MRRRKLAPKNTKTIKQCDKIYNKKLKPILMKQCLFKVRFYKQVTNQKLYSFKKINI